MNAAHVIIDGKAYAPKHPRALALQREQSPQQRGPDPAAKPSKGIRAAKRIRQDSKPLLNELETEWLVKLRLYFPDDPIKAQAIRLKIANGVTLTPDFFVFHPDKPASAYEVKGDHAWEDSLIKLKVAAGVFREFAFFLVWKTNGAWVCQKVIP